MTYWGKNIGIGVAGAEALPNFRELPGKLEALLVRHPRAELIRNGVGNVAIVVPNSEGKLEYIAWIDVLTGELTAFDFEAEDD